MSEGSPGLITIRGSLKAGLPMLLTPVLLLAVALSLHSFFLLDLVHVGSGLTWTGMDLVLGIFFSNVMKGLRNDQRARVAIRLVPMMLFFMPSISSVTVTAGVYLALADGYFSPIKAIIIVVLSIVGALFALGLGVFLPNEVRIYLQLLRGGDMKKVVRLTMINLRLSFVMVILQIAVILMMAQLATGVFI